MFCQSCGKEVPEGAAHCAHCGVAQPSLAASAAGAGVVYAGFWLRFVAIIIDSLVFSVISVPVMILCFLMVAARVGGVAEMEGEVPPEVVFSLLPLIFLVSIGLSLLWYAYFAFLESSEWQASVGKKVIGLKVTDLEGNRLTFARAAGRAFGKIITDMTMAIGYIIAGFTQKKQALHDIIADCLVVRVR